MSGRVNHSSIFFKLRPVHAPGQSGFGSTCYVSSCFITVIIIIIIFISNYFLKYLNLIIIHIKGKIDFFLLYFVLFTITKQDTKIIILSCISLLIIILYIIFIFIIFIFFFYEIVIKHRLKNLIHLLALRCCYNY
jgi:hypothetical protein